MLGLIIDLVLMGILLFGIMKVYVTFPFLTEYPLFSGSAGIMLLIALLWVFPKLIGFFIKFIVFCCVVFFICHSTGIDFKTFSKKSVQSAQNKVEQVTDTAKSVSEALEGIQETADNVKNLVTPSEVVTSRVKEVQSGNIMTFNNETVQLYGIDTPDLGQRCKTKFGSDYSCGQQSQTELKNFIQDKDVKCELKGKNKMGRRVATCSVNGDDLAALMVRNGWAVADKKQTDKYVEEERSAYLRKSGMWNGKFQAPWDWRQKHSATQQTNTQTNTQGKSKEDKKSKLSPLKKIMGFFSK